MNGQYEGLGTKKVEGVAKLDPMCEVGQYTHSVLARTAVSE